MKRLFKLLMVSALMLRFTACVPEAPRLNPLDPFFQSKDSSVSSFAGEILKKNDPRLPIPDCLVLLLPEQLFTRSNESGRFQFQNIGEGVHQFVISKEGFSTDTFFVDVDTVSQGTVVFHLNGNPYLKDIHIFSEFIDQWWPDPITTVNVQVIVDDPDGISDIEMLKMQVPDITVDTSLQSTSQPDSFVLRMEAGDFPNEDPFGLIGKDIWIQLEDKSNMRVREGPFHLIRILENSPEPLSPAGLQTAGPSPLFVWQPYPASFKFTYEIWVFVIQGGLPNLLFRDDGLPDSQFQYQYPDSLSPGTYFWTVGVRDELGNFSRSKEASFVVP